MKEKILTLSNGKECYVVEEVIVDRRKFCLAYEVDTEAEIVYNKFMILEEKIEDGNIIVCGLTPEEREKITTLIFDKIRADVEDSNI